jgi:uroporphyrinogen-III decarboxylase
MTLSEYKERKAEVAALPPVEREIAIAARKEGNSSAIIGIATAAFLITATVIAVKKYKDAQATASILDAAPDASTVDAIHRSNGWCG